MPLNKYQQFCYKQLGRIAERKENVKLQEKLSAAHINMRSAAYLSYTWLSALLVLVVSYAVFGTIFILFTCVLNVQLNLFLTILFLVLPALFGALAYGVLLVIPSSTASSRGKRIDLSLPYALNFIAAMSSAGITPTEIFKSLSKQEIYGEIKEEASWIYRDVGFLGSDIITALRANIQRTPSQKFKEFLQGTVVTVTSGGSLKSYFMAKADQYMRENRQIEKQRLESLGIMAESYVTAAVAGILMLLVVIPLMMIVSLVSGSLSPDAFQDQLMIMYIVVFVLIPIVHVGFAVVIKSMTTGG